MARGGGGNWQWLVASVVGVTAVHNFPAELHNNGTMWWPNIEIRYISLLLFTVARILSRRTADDTHVDVDSGEIERDSGKQGPWRDESHTKLVRWWCGWWKKIDICHIWFRICIFIANRLCFTDVNHFSPSTTTRAFSTRAFVCDPSWLFMSALVWLSVIH